MKIILIIFGFLLWRKFLFELIGSEDTYAIFLLQAIYCRFLYFRDSQMLFTVENIPILHPEVIDG